MGIDDWSTDESQNLELDGSDISRRASPGAPANELARKLMAHVKELERKIVSDGIEVDGVTIVNNDGTLTVTDVAIGGDTDDLLTEKIAEIEAAAAQAGEDATAAQTAATQAAASAASAATAITSASTAANLAAEQADIAARAAGRAQAGAALAESAVQAVVAQTNLNWQHSEKAQSVAIYPVPETALEPVVHFRFSETDPAEGDKAPDNPSAIEGVSSITVTHCESEGVDETAYAVDLGGTFYGGMIDIATGAVAVTHEYLTMTAVSCCGTADANGLVLAYAWSTHWGQEYVGATLKSLLACAEFPLTGDGEKVYLGNLNPGNNLKPVYIRLLASRAGVEAGQTDAQRRQACSSYLSSHPVHLVFEKQDPSIFTLSSISIKSLAQKDKFTPRLNTFYTDANSVQVGYAKSPLRTEYELTQAILAVEGGE